MMDVRTLTVTEVCNRTKWKRCTVIRLLNAGKLRELRAEGPRSKRYVLEASLEELFEPAKPKKKPHDIVDRRAQDDVDRSVMPEEGENPFV